MYDDLLEILEKIDVEQKEHPNGELDIKISAQLDTGEVVDLCEAVASWTPYESDGWRLWYETLSEEDIFKVAFLMKKCSKSNHLPVEIQLACKLVSYFIDELLELPCRIEIKRRESGYFEAIENKLEFYLPIDDFEAAHEKTHNIIKVLATSFETGGWVHALHRN